MASVVFFRAVNAGGHQEGQPNKLAKELAEFVVVNIRAAVALSSLSKIDGHRPWC